MSRHAPLPFQPVGDDGPVFRAPWEAQAFALVLALNEQGLFSWQEWAAELAAQIDAARQRGEADLGDNYYHHWLRALEKIASAKGLSDHQEISTRAARWRLAYLKTPHGQPIELHAADAD